MRKTLRPTETHGGRHEITGDVAAHRHHHEVNRHRNYLTHERSPQAARLPKVPLLSCGSIRKSTTPQRAKDRAVAHHGARKAVQAATRRGRQLEMACWAALLHTYECVTIYTWRQTSQSMTASSRRR